MLHKLCRTLVLLILIAGCKAAPISETTDLGGNIDGYNCHELTTEYANFRGRITSAIQLFEKELKKLQSAPMAVPPRPKSDEEGNDKGVSTVKIAPGAGDPAANPTGDPFRPGGFPLQEQGENDPTKYNRLLGVSKEDALPTLPTVLIDADSSGPHQPDDCDFLFGQYKTNTSTQVVPLCHEVLEYYRLAEQIAATFNRKKECRDGKATTQSTIASTNYGFCHTKCSFANGSTCAKCPFKWGVSGKDVLTDAYICHGKNDAINAIDQFCKSGGYSCTFNPSDCEVNRGSQFGAQEKGTSDNKINTNFGQFSAKIFARMEADASVGAKVSVNGETSFTGVIKYGYNWKEFNGEQPFINGVGNSNLHFNCFAELMSITMVTRGASVGAGFDIGFAKASVSGGTQLAFEAGEIRADLGRDILGAGLTNKLFVESCLPFAKNFTQHELPQLVAAKVGLTAVAKAFMGEEKGNTALPPDLESQKLWFSYPKGNGFRNGEYQIIGAYWEMNKDRVGFSYKTSSANFGFTDMSPTYGWVQGDLGSDLYAKTRELISKGTIDANFVKSAIEKAAGFTVEEKWQASSCYFK